MADDGESVVLYGGAGGGTQVFEDTWRWAAGTWTRLTTSTSPGTRSHAAMSFAGGRQALLFGGLRGADLFADSWVWDGAANQWTDVTPAGGGVSPPARRDATLAYHPRSGKVVLFGGKPQGAALLRDTWLWDPGSRTWADATARDASGNPDPTKNPPARLAASMAYDGTDLVLFGGDTSTSMGGVALDTWTWDGSAWSSRSPSTSPPARRDATMSFDAERQVLVLFGGRADDGIDADVVPIGLAGAVLADTWTWDRSASTWVQQSPPLSPPPRRSAAIAFDPSAGRAVLFGGATGTANSPGLRNDTWTYPHPVAG